MPPFQDITELVSLTAEVANGQAFSTTPTLLARDQCAVCRRPPPPPGLDLGENSGPSIITAAAVTWTLAVVAVVLRVVSRKMKRIQLWWDDYLILVSLVSILALVIIVLAFINLTNY